MSWMGQLFDTFENNISRSQSDIQLTPVAHMYANAQIEVTLNREGLFLSAVKVEKENAPTLIPVTESSAGRASGIAPHALCDTLSYIAGDFSMYCNDNDKQKRIAEQKYQTYIENLKKWADSEDTHPKVQVIYKYLYEKILILDLIKEGIVDLNQNGRFDNKKISGQSYEKCIVRFRVFGDDGKKDCTWKDDTLIQSYTNYYLKNMQADKDICYFTGRESVISKNHPKGIVASDYGAKLISANDMQGYTFLGRFHSAEQAYALSYDASQKIHSALTWLSKTKSAAVGTRDKRTFICWNPKGKEIPDVINEFDLIEDEEVQGAEINYQKKLLKTLNGYQNQFDETDSVIVMGLDAATTGRLSATYYHELKASDFLERIMYWGISCNWFFLKFNEMKKIYYAIETPVFYRIVQCAFGREKGKFIEVDDKVLKEQTQRLVKCMLEKQPVPYNLVHALFIRASTPMAYNRGNRERVLSTACALIRKFYYDKTVEKREEKDDMKLDLENSDRSYLFGRLLAVYEYIERITYDKGETRDPNAIRLQSAYVNHPMQTWKILEGLLNPYFQKLKPGARMHYKNLISELVSLILDEDERKLNQELKETYLLGYYLQRAELYKKKEENTEEEENGKLTK